jgi:hypothetical protein
MASGGGVVNPGTFLIKQKQHLSFTVNEGPVRFQYKCLVPIYVFPERKLLFPKQSYSVLSPSSVRDKYMYYMIRVPILLQGNMWTDPENI